MSQDVKYPNVKVELIGHDGNAFAVVGAVIKALKKAGIAQSSIDAYKNDAFSGDYDHLLRVTASTVQVS